MRLNEPIAFCYILNRSFVKAKFEAIVHILLPSVFEKLILNFLSIPCFKKKSLQGHLKDGKINYSVTLPWLPWRSTVIVWLSPHNHVIWSLSSVQSLSRVWLSATSWTTVRQASLSITNSLSLLKLTTLAKWSLCEGSVDIQSDLKKKKKKKERKPAV